MAQPAHYRYTNGSEPRIGVARAAYWLRTDELEEALERIRNENLDTVEGRRDAMGIAHNLRKQRGRLLFSMSTTEGMRFPNGWDDFYLTTMDEEFSRAWNGLLRALESRDTDVAKDTQTGRQQGAPATGPTAEKTSQSSQDNRKAMAELVNKLAVLAHSEPSIWNRYKFERNLGLRWE